MLPDAPTLVALGFELAVIREPDPGAGQTLSFTVPGGYEWQVVSVGVGFSTSAVATSRYPYLRVRNDADELARFPLHAAWGASLSMQISWVVGIGYALGDFKGPAITVPLELPLLPTGYTLDLLCTGLDVGDDFGFPRVTVYRRLTDGGPPDDRGFERPVRPLLERELVLE